MATAVVKGREGVVLEPDGDGSDALVRLSPASDLATITVSSILSLVSIRTSASLGSAGQRANRRSTAALDSYLRDRRQSESNISIEAPGRSSCSQEIDDALDGGIGAVIGGFEPAVWTVLRVRPVMEAAVGEGAAQALVEEEEEQGDLDALGREPVGVARAVALDQAVSLELAQVVAELVQTVGLLREVEGVEDGLMDLPGRPAADLRTAMQEDLEQADDARLVDLEAGITHRADRDRMGEALQQREIDMHVEPLGLEAGEAIRDRLEGGPHGIEMVEPLAQAEVGEIVGDQFVAQKGQELLILFEEAALEVGAEDMMAVLDLVDDRGQLAMHPATDPLAEDRGDLVSTEPPQAEFAAALEELVDGKVAPEDEVAAVLDLGDGVEARQVELGALLL